MPLFERGYASHVVGRVLRSNVAPFLQKGQALNAAGDLVFKSGAFFVGGSDLSTVGDNAVFLLAALLLEALEFGAIYAEVLTDTGQLGLELLQHVSRGHGLLFGIASFGLKAVNQSGELFDLATKCQNSCFSIAQSPFQVFQQPEDFPKFAFHGKRALGALLSAGNRDIVEALAGRGEEEGVRILVRSYDRFRCH